MRNLPKGWEWKKLGEICTLVRGSSPRPKGDPRFYGGKVPRLMISDITRDGKYTTPETDFLTEEGAKLSRPMKKGEVIMAVSGNPGLATILEVDACIHDGFVGFRELKNELKSEFLYYYLKFYKELHGSQSVGAVFKNLNTMQIKKFNVPVPPLPIQQKIVTILERAESLKQKREQANEEANKIIQNIFYEMFGDPIKNEKCWDVEKFENVCEKLFAGGDVPKEYFSKEETNEFKIPIYSNGTADKALYGYTNIEKVQKDSVTISARGTIGFPVMRKAPFYPIIRLVVATPDTSKVNIFYFKEAISFFNFDKGGTSIPQLPVPMIKKNKISVPPISLQNQFASIVEKIESIKQKQNKATSEINTLFDALMQKAFKGELVG